MQALLDLLKQTQVVVAVTGLIVLLLFEQAHPFFDFFKQSKTSRWRHFLRNASLGIVNALVTTFLFVGIWLWASTWANTNGFGILNWLQFPDWARVIIAVLLMDTWTYF